MKKMILLLTLLSYTVIFSNNAIAYLGPGAGLGAMGSILAIVLALVIIILGVIIYPIRKYLSHKSKKKAT